MLRELIDIETLVFWAFHEEEVERSVDADADAIVVAMATTALPEPHRKLIQYFGRLGHAPPWTIAPSQVVALDRVRNARIAYREWVKALVVLRCSLAGELDNYRVTGPNSPQEPWRRSA